MNHGQEVGRVLLVAGGDAAELFELGEEALDEMAFLVEVLVVGNGAGP
jgi:hypothetical protein